MGCSSWRRVRRGIWSVIGMRVSSSNSIGLLRRFWKSKSEPPGRAASNGSTEGTSKPGETPRGSTRSGAGVNRLGSPKRGRGAVGPKSPKGGGASPIERGGCPGARPGKVEGGKSRPAGNSPIARGGPGKRSGMVVKGGRTAPGGSCPSTGTPHQPNCPLPTKTKILNPLHVPVNCFLNK